MSHSVEDICRLCERPIGNAAPVEQRNRNTGEIGVFHEWCWSRVLEERRTRPEREAAQRQTALEIIDHRFKVYAQGPEGFDSQLPVWAYARFDNATFRDLVSPTILSALENWQPADGNVILSAKTGAGKTAGTVARIWQFRTVAEQAYDPAGLPRFLFTTAALLSGARRQVKLGTGESPLVERAMDVDVLALDEVGFEPIDGVSFEVVDARYRKQLPTIVTTGLKPAEFAARYGSAVWRRLTESGKVVEDHGRKMAAVR